VTNVLILMSDEHNPRVASVYGHPQVETPNMERLANRGVTYDAAYCPSPLCAPSRSSFLSGLPVHQTQVYNNCNLDDLDLPSFGAVLHQQGVHTINIGKADGYTTADKLGFSEFRLAGDRKPPGDTNFCRNPLAVREDGPERANGYGPREGAFAKDLRVVDEAIEWFHTSAPAIELAWSLTVNIVAPHFPHYATPELWEKYAGQGDLPEISADVASAQHPYAQDLRRHFQTEGFTDAQIRGLRQGYLAGVDFVDGQLGRLLDALEETGVSDETVVVYTSDHGEMLGTFGMWWKCSMYEDSIRVPLIVAGPGFPTGQRSSTPVSLLDVQASIFRTTETRRPDHWWGEPLQDLALNDSDRVVIAEYHGHGTRSGSFMIRRGPWKLLVHDAAPNQLFDLGSDPYELVDLHDQQPGIVARLQQELAARCSPTKEFARAAQRERELLDRLAARAA
jgi:choline-sulfatase